MPGATLRVMARVSVMTADGWRFPTRDIASLVRAAVVPGEPARMCDAPCLCRGYAEYPAEYVGPIPEQRRGDSGRHRAEHHRGKRDPGNRYPA